MRTVRSDGLDKLAGLRSSIDIFSPVMKPLQIVEHRQRCTESDVGAIIEKVLAMEAAGCIPPWQVGTMHPLEGRHHPSSTG